MNRDELSTGQEVVFSWRTGTGKYVTHPAMITRIGRTLVDIRITLGKDHFQTETCRIDTQLVNETNPAGYGSGEFLTLEQLAAREENSAADDALLLHGIEASWKRPPLALEQKKGILAVLDPGRVLLELSPAAADMVLDALRALQPENAGLKRDILDRLIFRMQAARRYQETREQS